MFCQLSLSTGLSYYIPAPHVKLLKFLCAYDNHNKNFHKNNNNNNNNGNTVVEDDDNNDTELPTIEIMIMIKFLNHL